MRGDITTDHKNIKCNKGNIKNYASNVEEMGNPLKGTNYQSSLKKKEIN